MPRQPDAREPRDDHAAGEQPDAPARGDAADAGVADERDGAAPDIDEDAAGSPVYPPLDPAAIGAVRQVVDGLKLGESPVWHPCRESLLFTDVDANVINELESDGTVKPFMTDTYYTNGMALARDGSLWLAQMGGGKGGRIARRLPSGEVEVIVDESPSGSPLHTVDDLVLRSDGTVYFTDADFPHGPYEVNVLTVTVVSLPVYVLKPKADGYELVKGPTLRGPNGVELSPDEELLYVASYFEDQIVKYQVAADGALTRQGVLASRLEDADSFCLDAAGNVYVGVGNGLQILRPDGTRVKHLPIRSANGTTNCTFGGPDGKTLYISSFEAISKVEKMPIPGLDWVRQQKLACD